MLDQITELATLLKDPSLLATKAYIAGDWADADSGATFEVTNPARGDVIARAFRQLPGRSRRALDDACDVGERVREDVVEDEHRTFQR